MRSVRFQAAQSQITAFFEKAPSKVWRQSKLRLILDQHRAEWNLPRSMRLSAFLGYLAESTSIREIRLEFPHRTELLYTWGEMQAYEIALTLRPQGYLTHYSAMALHDLTDQIPRTVYLNVEQAPKLRHEQSLEQKSIDTGFGRKPRVSANIAQYGDYRICLLSGMHTGGVGVTSTKGANGEMIKVAGLVRTLIDIAVRPFYAGGVYEVLGAYKRARGRFDVEQVAKMYRRLKYVYPYHQAIGFYLEKAGYSGREIESMGPFQMKYDFYLTHQMKNPQYSPRWRLYFPKGF